MKTALDNITLIKKFLKGEGSLLANRELRLEKALAETQLLTTQGILLAKGRLTERQPHIVIRLNSNYWDLLNHLTIEAGFIPFQINQERARGDIFAQYDLHNVPTGYQLHCQEATVFWKTWWVNHRSLELMDMLLLCNKRWYPINQMVCDTGTIYVKTWRGEQVLSLADTVVWLDRQIQQQQKQRGTRPKRHTPAQFTGQTSATAHPNPTTPSTPQTNPPQGTHPLVPDALRQVIRAGENKLLVHTALGPVIIQGQNLTCTLARKVAKTSQ